MMAYFAVLLLLLAFSFAFSGFETAISSLPKIEIKNMMSDQRYRRLQIWLDNPSEYLTAILVGNSIVNIFFATVFTILLVSKIGLPRLNVEILSIVLSTILILIFGEITPKTFARSYPLFMVQLLFPFISFTSILLRPLLAVLNPVVGLFFRKKLFPERSKITHDDLSGLISSAVEKGVIKTKQGQMINSTLALRSKKVSAVMTQFDDIEMVEYDNDTERFLDILVEKEKSRIPVYRDHKENIVGLIYLKDVLQTLPAPPQDICDKLLRPVTYAEESDDLYGLFEKFKKMKVHIALVRKDGVVTGLITLEDILEEIIGEILDEYDVRYCTVEKPGLQEREPEGKTS